MVAAKLYGGLGNQMFQQAAAIGYAMKYNIPFNNNRLAPGLPTMELKETGHNYNNIPNYFGRNRNILLNGYFQSEKYFDHCKEQIRAYFYGPTEIEKGTCSIHVRRGDYLLYPDKHPVVTMEYINKAVDIIYKKGISHFKVFSDGIDWCREEFDNLPNGHFEFMERSVNASKDMLLMAECEHNIIANSTFSWWGAWLSPNPDKIVISPSTANWFGPGNSKLCTDDIIPDNWIQIKY
jgi:Glycosyl transferase family 11.